MSRTTTLLTGSALLLTLGALGSPALAATGSESPAAGSSTPQCTAADVRVRLTDPEGAAGTTYYQLRMRNTSDHACRSGGYGGVSLVRRAGHQLGSAAVRVHDASAPVTPFVLIPGAHATATLGIAEALDYPTDTCRPRTAQGLRVYVPNETRSVFIPTTGITGCRSSQVDLLHLQPYQPVS